MAGFMHYTTMHSRRVIIKSLISLLEYKTSTSITVQDRKLFYFYVPQSSISNKTTSIANL